MVLPPAAAPVAAQNTQARSFLTTQVGILNHSAPFLATRGPKLRAALRRASKARFWSLVDFIFLRQTEPARPAKWIRPPKVSDRRRQCVRVLWVLELSLFSLCRRNGTYTVANGQVTCIAREMVLKRQLSETSDSGKPEPQQTTPVPPPS